MWPGDVASGTLGMFVVRESLREARRTTHIDTADPGRDDVLAGGEDVDDRAEVGEGRAGVGDRARTDGDRRRGAGGGERTRIGVVVTRSNGYVNTLGGELGRCCD